MRVTTDNCNGAQSPSGVVVWEHLTLSWTIIRFIPTQKHHACHQRYELTSQRKMNRVY